MLPTTDLLSRLVEIDTAYQAESDPTKALAWAKLASIEVGGWTEECIDKVIQDFVAAKNPRSKNKILERLEKVYGFKYSVEFRSIVVDVIGSIYFDIIEARLAMESQRLESALNELKQSRDTCAHTYTKPGQQIDAPSKTIDLLKKIEKGLSLFNGQLYTLQFT